MSLELDALLEGAPLEPPTMAGAAGRKCARHRWLRIAGGIDTNDGDGPLTVIPDRFVCMRCNLPRDEAKSRRGRNSNRRGRSIQAKRITGLGGRNLAGNNENLDGLGELFAYESKSGAAFSERIWRWLSGIPKRGHETGVLIVTETPGRGHKARSYVVVDYDQWRDLHGEIAR